MVSIRSIWRSSLSTFAAAALFVVPASVPPEPEDHFTDWAEPQNLGPGANSAQEEFGVTVSRDGRSLYFHSGRPGGFGGTDIWVSRRHFEEDQWGPAENLGPSVNSEFNENTPRLSMDGHRLYFASDRLGGFGGSDVYVSRRRGKADDLAWEAPQNVGSGVNSPVNDGGPAPWADDANGTTTLYFFSTRPGGFGGADIYASTLLPNETFGPAVWVQELSSTAADIVPSLRRDGLEMILTSNRPGSMPFPGGGFSFDLWVSKRASINGMWSVPTNLGAVVNTSFNDGWAALSFDGMILYFSTRRPGALGTSSLDLYMSTRSKTQGPEFGGSAAPSRSRTTWPPSLRLVAHSLRTFSMEADGTRTAWR